MLFNQICVQKNTRKTEGFTKNPTVFAETARDFNTDKIKNLSFFIKKHKAKLYPNNPCLPIRQFDSSLIFIYHFDNSLQNIFSFWFRAQNRH